jgi:hypothetical protein
VCIPGGHAVLLEVVAQEGGNIFKWHTIAAESSGEGMAQVVDVQTNNPGLRAGLLPPLTATTEFQSRGLANVRAAS